MTSFTQGVQLNFGSNVSSSAEGVEVFVTVVKQGYSFGNITVRIVPLTYDQFEARGFDIDNVFPTRPPPASGKSFYCQYVLHICCASTWFHTCESCLKIVDHNGQK